MQGLAQKLTSPPRAHSTKSDLSDCGRAHFAAKLDLSTNIHHIEGLD